LPLESERVEYEAEIAVVIGRRVRRVSEAQALAAVAGITCLNDVTARDLQRSEEQWTRAKGFDTFCPVGPRVAPLDPARLSELEVRCRVNGVERQRGSARDMVFGIAALVAFVSQAMTLEPGDLIATGTPAGVGPWPPSRSTPTAPSISPICPLWGPSGMTSAAPTTPRRVATASSRSAGAGGASRTRSNATCAWTTGSPRTVPSRPVAPRCRGG